MIIDNANTSTSMNFLYEQSELKVLANDILQMAKQLGATDAEVEITEGVSQGVDILNHEIENIETSYGNNLALSVYINHNVGNISTTNIDVDNIDSISWLVQKAIDIAKYTEADDRNGIAESQYLCKNIDRDLQLCHNNNLNINNLINDAKCIELAGIACDNKLLTSDGASVSLSMQNFVLASTNGINLGYQMSSYANSLKLIAKTQDNSMQSDYWYSKARNYNNLLNADTLAKTAFNRILRRLNKDKITSGKYAVIFESSVAKAIISSFLNTITGNAQYRKLSFLQDSLRTQIFSKEISIIDDPYINQGLSSCYFDAEGVKVQTRSVVDDGILENYILSCYSARKLNLQPTGNAGGTHNIIVNFANKNLIKQFNCDKTINPVSDTNIDTLIKQMYNGLIIIETIGNGINSVTGDYSFGASGLLVKNGIIQFFVDNITISGNLKQLFSNIINIANDCSLNSSMLCGSLLTDGVLVSA